MDNYELIFYLFIICLALMANYYYEIEEKIVFVYDGSDKDTYHLTNILKNTNRKVILIPKNQNPKTMERIREMQKIRKIYRMDTLENFSEVVVKNLMMKKPRLIYSSDKDIFYVLANKINTKGYDYDYQNKIDYKDWNYVGQNGKTFNQEEENIKSENNLIDYQDDDN